MVQKLISTALAVVLPLVVAQQIGNSPPEVHPKLPTWECTLKDGCIQRSTSIVLDSNYRPIDQVANPSLSCATSSGMDPSLCPDEVTCAINCAFEGADYTSSGISVSGDAVTFNQYVDGKSASPRAYLLASDGDYELLHLNGRELRFDVDASTLVCGENGGLYLSQMDASGGRSPNNPGGASYGTGYCDAQCPVQAFRNGTLNTSGQGFCCNEMDIWEANSQANAMTPHVCENNACDSDGCGYNPYGQGSHSFYGPGLTVDTNHKFTVITQFYTDNGKTSGNLVNIQRQYVQNGNTIGNPGNASITTSSCTSANNFGGLATMGTALEAGMVLVFSIWNDNSQFMNWLDSGSSGPCSSTAGNPANILANNPGTHATFSNIRWGEIGSTGKSQGTSRGRRSIRSRL